MPDPEVAPGGPGVGLNIPHEVQLTSLAVGDINDRLNETQMRVGALEQSSGGGDDAGTNHNVAWENGFSGTATLRHNGAVVSCQIERVVRANDVLENQDIRMFAYPAGVPGPWATLIVATSALDNSTAGWIGWMEECEVQFRPDGVWLQALDNRQINMGWDVSATATWAK